MREPKYRSAIRDRGQAQVLVAMRRDAPRVPLEEFSTRHFLPAGIERPAARLFHCLGVILGHCDEERAERLESHPHVEAIRLAEPMTAITSIATRDPSSFSPLAWGIGAVGADKVWAARFQGDGVTVAHLDTGVDASHSALGGRIASFVEFDSNGIPVAGALPHDSDVHGTHTAGTICGGADLSGSKIGVAPGARLACAIVIDGGDVLRRVLAGLEWTLASTNARIVNLSAGFPGTTDAFADVVRRIREHGVLPVFAIGNDGLDTSRSPANYADALGVGAADSTLAVAPFSGSQSFERPDDPMKPDLVAPGVNVLSARPGGGLREESGTSMAAPHVAGVAALLLSAKPTASVDELEAALLSGCTVATDETAPRAGRGFLDAQKALSALLKT